MEGTGQNFVSRRRLLATHPSANWAPTMFGGDAEATAQAADSGIAHAVPLLSRVSRSRGAVGEADGFASAASGTGLEEFGIVQDHRPLLDEERCGVHSSNAPQQDVADGDFAAELEGMLLGADQPLVAPVSANDHAATRDAGLVPTTVGDGAASTQAVNGAQWPVLPAAERIGVTYHRKNQQWEAHLWVKDLQLRKRKKKGKQIFLGNYPTADEAKRAHDRAAIKLNVRETARGKPYPLNFPESAHARYLAEHSGWSVRDFVWKLRRWSAKFNKGESSMKGVSVRKSAARRRGKNWNAAAAAVTYEAKISRTMGDGGKRTFDLGRFASEEDAARAYDRALLFLKGADELKCITNFRPSSYSAAEIAEAGTLLTRS